MKKTLLCSMVAFIATITFAQNVNIPDANFKAYLVGNTAINTNSDAEIQVSEAVAFTGSISCPGQNIADLTGIEEFINLTYLYCNDNQLTSLDVSQNTALEILWCNQNQLTSLDVTSNTALTTFRCYSNQLTSIDVSQNVLLTHIICSGNPITSLDLSQNLALIDLQCSNTSLTTLDVSANTALTSVSCHTGQLTSLNVANGNNTNFTNFASISNPNLYCIEVDDAAYSTANWTNIDGTSFFSEDCANCTVNIPDANFKAYLVGNTAINTNSDGEIQCTEAHSFTGDIMCDGLNIADLTGIEAFTSINQLRCQSNDLTSLDVSQNTTLTTLFCYNNQLSSLDVSQNAQLQYVAAGFNQLSSITLGTNSNLLELNVIDNSLTTIDVSQCPALYELYCYNNNLSAIDVSQNLNLTDFRCQGQQISTLDVSSNTALEILICGENTISSLDVSNCTSLEVLNCKSNSLSSLDLSANLGLTELICNLNSITSLDLSNHSNLVRIECATNLLTSLNVANGNNSNVIFFTSQQNPSLTCIEVDDETFSTTNWTFIDAASSFSEDCFGGSIGINDRGLNNIKIYPNPLTGDMLNITSDQQIQSIRIYNLLGEEILNTSSNRINTRGIPPGTYLISIQTNEGSASLKFVKQ